MKIITTITILLTVFAGSLCASQYEDLMNENIKTMYSATSSSELTDLANHFERMAQMESETWLPLYYAAYSYTAVLFVDKDLTSDEQHQWLDKAQAMMDIAMKQDEKQSELYALQALIYQMRITDASKGYKYSSLAGEMLKKAETLDQYNPRVQYLLGMNILHTPKAFGGGALKARPYFEHAAELFDVFQAKSTLHPTWGAMRNADQL